MMADTTDEEVEILDESSEKPCDLERMAREATAIEFVNLFPPQAIQEHAGDFHVELFEKGMFVRYRIDGVLREISDFRLATCYSIQASTRNPLSRNPCSPHTTSTRITPMVTAR